jgi:DNA-binding transcriptional regulator PaaX
MDEISISAAVAYGIARFAAAPTARSTKSSVILSLLCRDEGATREELIAATGWLPHTLRAALTGLRKKGHAIDRTQREGQSCYRLAGVA